MLVEIEDLEIGDEVIITNSINPKYLRILEVPRESKKLNWDKSKRFIAVRCLTNMKQIPKTYNRYDHVTKTYVPKVFYDTQYHLSEPDDTAVVEKVNLNYKKIWLVKKGDNYLNK
jgi:hypothetical protein